MPVDFNFPSRLMEFNAAASGEGANKTIRATDKGAVGTTNSSVWTRTNLKTIQNFVSAVRTEFGTRIADAALEQINEVTQNGKLPLKGFMVRTAVDRALSTYQSTLLARDRFFAGVGEPTFTSAVDAHLEGLPENLRDRVLAEAKTELQERLRDVSPCPSVNEIVEMLANTPVLRAARTVLSRAFTGRDLPGTLEDKLDLLRMLTPANGSNKDLEGLASLALQKLPQCRELQAQGAITRETLWETLTDEAFPQNPELNADNFARELLAKVEEQLSTRLESTEKAKNVLSSLGTLRFEEAVEIAQSGRPMKLEDFLRPEAVLEGCRQIAEAGRAEESVAATVATLSNRTINGKKAPTEITFKMHGGVAKYPCGQAAESTYPFPTKDEKKAYTEGRPSLYTQDLHLRCDTMSGGRPAQREALFALFSLSPEKLFGTGTGALLGSRVDAHMPFSYTVERANNDTLRVSIASQDAAKAGRARASILVLPDGSYRFETIKVESPTVAQIHERIQAKNGLTALGVDFLTASYFARVDALALSKLSERKRNEAIDAFIEQSRTKLDGVQFINTHFSQTWSPAQCTEFGQRVEANSKAFLPRYFLPGQAVVTEWMPGEISKSYLFDANRDKASTVCGEPFRRVPLRAPMPGVAEQHAGFTEQLCEAIAPVQTRKLTSILASQAGLIGSLAVSLRSGELFGEPIADSPDFHISYQDRMYTVTVDPALPNAVNPNLGRFAHVQSDSVIAISLGAGAPDVKLLQVRLIADIPFEQPEDGMPNFSLRPAELTTLV